MLASTLSRPRCGIPMQISSIRSSAARHMTRSIRAMTDSPPSSENRFCPTNLVCRNVSNASAALSFLRIRICSSRDGRAYGTSTLAWIQARCSGSWMCMYSMPTVRQ